MILSKEEISRIPKEERYALMGELWKSLQQEEKFELTEEQIRILDERLEFAEKNPEAFTPWEKVRERLEKYLDAEG